MQERWNFTRRNVGFPDAVTFLVAYPSVSACPTESSLSKAIVELQEHFPMLRSRIVDGHTRTPCFEQLARPWDASDVLAHRVYEPLDGGIKEKDRLLFDEVKRMANEDIDARPAWQVSLYTSPTHPGPVYLALSADHAFTDGRGMLRIIRALVDPDSIGKLSTENLEDLPRMEDTINLEPSWSHLVPLFMRELILPKLPTFIQNYFATTPFWPRGEIKQDPTTVPEGSSLMELPADVMERLKAISKEHGVHTIHSTIQTAYLVAMWSTFGRNRSPPSDPSKPFVLKVEVPVDERRAALGHPYCTREYVTHFVYDVPITPMTDFWAEAAKTSIYIRSEAARQHARGGIGLIAYLPDPDPARTKFQRGPTGWEDFALSCAKGQGAIRESLAFSNVGWVELPEGAEDIVWSQSCWPLGMAMQAGVVGHKNGLRLVTIWREGAIVNQDQVKETERVYIRMLERLTDPGWERTTVEDLVT